MRPPLRFSFLVLTIAPFLAACSGEGEPASEARATAQAQETTPSALASDPCAGPSLRAVFGGRSEGLFDENADSPYGEELLNYTLGLIRSVPAGEDLYASTKHFTCDQATGFRLQEELVAAASRGVSVRVLLDEAGGAEGRCAPDTLRAGLADVKAEMPDLDIQVRVCEGSCAISGNRFVQHTKFFAASGISCGGFDPEPLVLISSANWNSRMLTKDNEAVAVRGDTELYDGMVAYFEQLLALDPEGWSSDVDPYFEFAGETETSLLAFPRLDGGDTIVELLDEVVCDPNNGPDSPSDDIVVSHSFWSRTAVLDKLIEKAREGCEVRTVTWGPNHVTEGSFEISKRLVESGCAPERDQARNGGCIHFRFMHGRDSHSKYIAVDAPHREGGQRRLLYHGSHNLTYYALYGNDELLLRIHDEAVFSDFKNHFERQWSRASARLDCTLLEDLLRDCSEGETPCEQLPTLERLHSECIHLQEELQTLLYNPVHCGDSQPCEYGQGGCDFENPTASGCGPGLACVRTGSTGLCLPRKDDAPDDLRLHHDFCVSPTTGHCSIGQGDCDFRDPAPAYLDADGEVRLASCLGGSGPGHFISRELRRSSETYFEHVDWERCSEEEPCEAGFGDCDSDAECKGHLICVDSENFNSATGIGTNMDVCFPPGHGHW